MGIFITFSEPNHKTKNTISCIENRFLEIRRNLKDYFRIVEAHGQVGQMAKVKQLSDRLRIKSHVPHVPAIHCSLTKRHAFSPGRLY